jgi:hypothetical protein
MVGDHPGAQNLFTPASHLGQEGPHPMFLVDWAP